MASAGISNAVVPNRTRSANYIYKDDAAVDKTFFGFHNIFIHPLSSIDREAAQPREQLAVLNICTVLTWDTQEQVYPERRQSAGLL